MEAPLELDQMGLTASLFKKSGENSYRGPCPKCGGLRRFVVFTDNAWPRWYGYCDECGWKGWADQLNPKLSTEKPDPLELKIREKQVKEHMDRRDEVRRQALEKFRTGADIADYHVGMSAENKAWWESQGIPDEWQVFYTLGYLASRTFGKNGTSFSSPCYTIPKFDLGWVLMNMDYRIMELPEGAVGKYRQEYGLASSAFISRPDYPELWKDGTVYVVEGSKKAMVTCIQAGGDAQVIGLPGCTSWAGIPERLRKGPERVYVIFDPDAEEWGQRFSAQVGGHARTLSLPMKIDDAFLHGGLTWRTFQQIIKQARRAS